VIIFMNYVTAVTMVILLSDFGPCEIIRVVMTIRV
jgi:hypothetical protein